MQSLALVKLNYDIEIKINTYKLSSEIYDIALCTYIGSRVLAAWIHSFYSNCAIVEYMAVF